MNFVSIKAGRYLMGTDDKIGFPEDLEGPQTSVCIEDFKISTTTITNAEFQNFVNQTGYISEAEASGWSFVFYKLLGEDELAKSKKVPMTPWWRIVVGANWKHPFGANSTIAKIMDHPVVHVSRNDAIVYCKWAHKRLPSEAEWEYAARGGTTNFQFPWGNDLYSEKRYHANTWQGQFPEENALGDGYLGTAPVISYEPNQYGLYQMIGNVWEWCANPRGIALSEFVQTGGKQFWHNNQTYSEKHYAMRGGSFLCHCSYCNRYRLGGRNGNTANTTSSNVGFRVVEEIGVGR